MSTAEKALSCRTSELNLIAQAIHKSDSDVPVADVEQVRSLVERLIAEKGHQFGMRDLKSVASVLRQLDQAKRDSEKMQLERAQLQLEAERLDVLKVGAALRAYAMRLPVDIFGVTIVSAVPGIESTDEGEPDEIDQLIECAETPEEHDVIERLLKRRLEM